MASDPSPQPPQVYTHHHQLKFGQPALASVCILVTRHNQVEVSWTSNTDPLRASLLVAEGLKVLLQVVLNAAADPTKQQLVVPVGDFPLPPFPGPGARA